MEIMIFGRTRNLQRIIPFIPLVLFAIGFWDELSSFVRWLWSGYLPMPPDVAHSFSVLATNLLCFFTLFLIWLGMVSAQTIFPVARPRDVILAASYLILHILGWHGLAAYVRNGKIKAFVDELQKPLPGAVVVDSNSAIAVEQIILPPGFQRSLAQLFRNLATLFRINLPAVRIQGAGLLFMIPDERIHGVNDLEPHPVISDGHPWMERILGVVDLRTQFRISGHQPHKLSKRLRTSVFAYTRDGIEVKTNIWVLATLGEEPVPYFPLNVTYVGDQHPENLRVVKFKTISKQTGLCRVESFIDELDNQDRLEIHERWQRESGWVPYVDSPRAPATPQFNAARVFAAIYARARHHRGLDQVDEIVPWVDLPLHVAIDQFREIISHFNYDDIYKPDANGSMQINTIRKKLATALRNSGLLAFRPVFHRTRRSLEAGRMYTSTELLTLPPAAAFSLTSPRLLRDRGIRIIASGFGDLVVDERIYKQRLDHWRAAWDQETEVVEAGLEWESMRSRTRARIQAQREFVHCLSHIYQSNATSKEILALRVLQALEGAAADPKTRQLLPEDTFSMLRNIHDWLLPQDTGYGTGP